MSSPESRPKSDLIAVSVQAYHKSKCEVRQVFEIQNVDILLKNQFADMILMQGDTQEYYGILWQCEDDNRDRGK